MKTDFKVYTWNDLVAGRFPCKQSLQKAGFLGTAVSVGAFDGVHLGHSALFDSVLAQKDLLSGVVTFSALPKSLSAKGDFLGSVSTLFQRLKIFEEKGFAFAIVIDFSDKFAKIKGTEFLSVLKERLSLAFLAEGTDFRCGYKGHMDISSVQEYFCGTSVKVQVVPPVVLGGERISSTAIRNAILEGNLKKAASFLGRSYALDCNLWRLESSEEHLRLIRSPCADCTEGVKAVQSDFQVLPPPANYDVSLCVKNATGKQNVKATACVNGNVLELRLKGKDTAAGFIAEGCKIESVIFTE